MGANLEITDTGISSPTSSEIKTAIQTIFTNSFGSELSLDDSTPQGALIDELTQLKQASNSVLLYLMNQFNPETASGIFQDALANLYFIQRNTATHSIVTCRCVGVSGTVLNGISTGSPALAQSTNGDIFECVLGGTIGSSGYVDLVFRSVETGEIPCGANTVSRIYQSVVGWDTVNNSASGTVGKEEESRADFEARRKESLALQATGSLSAVQAGIANLDGITHYKVWENCTNASVTTSGQTLNPYSIWVCVNSAVDSDDVAEVIYKNKSAGCDTNKDSGSRGVTCSYTDPTTGVSYSYGYDTPEDVNTWVKVTVQNTLPTETQTAIKQAIWNNFNGNGDDDKITIGDSVYAGRFFKALSDIDANIVQIQVSKTSSSSGYANYIDYNLYQLPVLGTLASPNVVVEVASA